MLYMYLFILQIFISHIWFTKSQISKIEVIFRLNNFCFIWLQIHIYHGSLIGQLLSREVEDYAGTVVGMDTLGKRVFRANGVQRGRGDDGEKRDQGLQTDFDTALLLYLDYLQ